MSLLIQVKVTISIQQW